MKLINASADYAFAGSFNIACNQKQINSKKKKKKKKGPHAQNRILMWGRCTISAFKPQLRMILVGAAGEREREVGSTGLLILSRMCESSAKVDSEKEPIMTEGEEESRAAAGSRLLLLLAELLLPLVLQL